MNMFWFSFIQLSILGFLPVQHFVLTFAASPGSLGLLFPSLLTNGIISRCFIVFLLLITV